MFRLRFYSKHLGPLDILFCTSIVFLALALTGCKEEEQKRNSSTKDNHQFPHSDPNQTAKLHGKSTELFVDATSECNLQFVHQNGMTGDYYFAEILGSGCALFDYDRDGDLDLYCVQGGPLENREELLQNPKQLVSDRLFKNLLVESGNLRFLDVTEQAGIEAVGYGMGVCIGDYDNDGWLDIFISNYGTNQLYRNSQKGGFEDRTQASGLSGSSWSTSCAFTDYDNDGDLDLFVCNYVDFILANNKKCYSESGVRDYCGPLSYSPQPDQFYCNLGDGTFEEQSSKLGLNREFGAGLGVICADLNGDQRMDFYVANDATENQAWIQQEDGSFENEALLAGCAVNENGAAEASMGVDCADFDNDGDLDLFMTHLADESNTLYINESSEHQLLFRDATQEFGLSSSSRPFTGFGSLWADFDRDGRQDLFVANGAVKRVPSLAMQGKKYPLHEKNQLYLNSAHGFRDASQQAGEIMQSSLVSRGLAKGDLDNDGDMDLIIMNSTGPAQVLLNQARPKASWIGVSLGTAKHPGASLKQSARLEFRIDNGASIWREAKRSGSYLSSHDPRVLLQIPNSPTGGAATPRVQVRIHRLGKVASPWKSLLLNRWQRLVE